MRKWTRRAFIGTGTLVGGGLIFGVGNILLAPNRNSLRSDDPAGKGELNTWILVTPDNLVTVLVPHCEMGQGAQTGLAMMAAEELGIALDKVRPLIGDTSSLGFNFLTGGSLVTFSSGMAVIGSGE